jgi:uncharacterized membrane protein
MFFSQNKFYYYAKNNSFIIMQNIICFSVKMSFILFFKAQNEIVMPKYNEITFFVPNQGLPLTNQPHCKLFLLHHAPV